MEWCGGVLLCAQVQMNDCERMSMSTILKASVKNVLKKEQVSNNSLSDLDGYGISYYIKIDIPR